MKLSEVIEKAKRYWQLMVGILILLAAVFIFFLRQEGSKKSSSLVSSTQLVVPSKAITQPQKAKASRKETDKKEVITVDVKGAVKHPYLYTLKKDSRVNDVVLLAGGLTDQADANSINLAQKLTDEMVIYVASKGEEQAGLALSKVAELSDQSGQAATDQVNINTADLAQLQKLSGVGMKKAQDIIAYREQNGNFKKVADLVNISGFGEKSIEKLKDSVTVD